VAEPSELVRIAWVARGAEGGELRVGPGRGRGAWLCAGSEDCFDQAVRRRAFGKALRRDVTTADVAELREKLFGETKSGD
jgi:predicted RNA-binding protein YlxR (DUF448 family)